MNEHIERVYNRKMKNLATELEGWEISFLSESNKLEDEYSISALEDAIIAWDFAKRNRFIHKNPEYVKNIHFYLMRNLNPEIAGRFRTCEVFVGDDEDIVNSRFIEEAMIGWCYGFNELKDSSEKIKEEHVRFLKIHPFADGNGRTARILMNIQNLNSGYNPTIFMAQEPPKGYEDYYDWFK